MIKLLYGEYLPLAAINYIWESKAPVGTMVPNPYTDRVMMFVVESGSAKLNQWVDEERNVYEDYKKAFGEEPPMISGQLRQEGRAYPKGKTKGGRWFPGSIS
jgi:hypothetical protein